MEDHYRNDTYVQYIKLVYEHILYFDTWKITSHYNSLPYVMVSSITELDYRTTHVQIIGSL